MSVSIGEELQYLVVISDEERYSIWPSYRDIPPGWHAAGFVGAKEACLAHIEEVWIDMRPRSLRVLMDGSGQAGDGIS